MGKTGSGLAAFAQNAYTAGWGYCLGEFGRVLTPDILQQKCTQSGGVGIYNSGHRSYLETFMGRRVSDCYGLVKAYAWWNDTRNNPVYDVSTDRNQEMACAASLSKGTIATLPEIPGVVLWMKGHCGIYLGGGVFVECVGAPVGMRKGTIENGRVTAGSPFTNWFRDSYIDYASGTTPLVLDGTTYDIHAELHDGYHYADAKELLSIPVSEVPVRAYFEMLGYTVRWENGAIDVTKNT